MNGCCVRILKLFEGQAETMPTFTSVPATRWKAGTGEGYWQEPDLRTPKTELHNLLALQGQKLTKLAFLLKLDYMF